MWRRLSYDAKWGIDFGEIGQAQVLGKLRKVLGPSWTTATTVRWRSAPGPATSASTCCRPGSSARRPAPTSRPGWSPRSADNARRLGLDVRAARADAESLPFADESFDLVLGHAVLHHLPNLRRAFSEFRRVLRPGGRIVFAGEPSRVGDRIATVPKRGAQLLAPAWRRCCARHPARRPPEEQHATGNGNGNAVARSAPPRSTTSSGSSTSTRSPPAICSATPTAPAFTDVDVRGEELAANWFGWFNRSLEASADPEDVPMLWRQYAFHGYLMLQRLDERLLEGRLPPAIFYNLLVTARRPD